MRLNALQRRHDPGLALAHHRHPSVQPVPRAVAHRVPISSPATTYPLGGPMSTSRRPGVSICPHLPIITGTSRQTSPLAWSGPSPARRHLAQIAQVALHCGQAGLGEQALERRGAAELAVAAPAQDPTLREGPGRWEQRWS